MRGHHGRAHYGAGGYITVQMTTALATALLSAACGMQDATCVIFVSPTGSDAASGRTATTAFATVHHAVHAARCARPPPPQLCTLHLLPGVHILSSPLVLEPADSRTAFKGPGAVLSGGLPIPPTCWTPQTNAPGVLQCVPPPEVRAALAARDVKVLRVGTTLSAPARFPVAAGPLPSQWCTLASSVFEGNNSFRVTVNASGECARFFARTARGWTSSVHIWPTRSWIDIHGATMTRRAASDGTNGPVFTLVCPDQLQCSDDSNSMSIKEGARFHLYGNEEMLSTPGDWVVAHEPTAGTPAKLLLTKPAGTALPSVRVPTMAVLVRLHGGANGTVRNISFEGLTFSDADFDAQGGQEGFNQADWPPAMPSDGALRVSRAVGVRVDGCTFSHLGGGGIHVGNASSSVLVRNSSFLSPGQSGVVLTGTAATQPHHVTVEGCTFESPGSILSSAAGVLASTASDCVFRGNSVSNSSRWGIAVRTQGAATSRNNLIELNRIVGSGQATRDLGGISLIGAGNTGTVIRSNCVKDTLGTDTNQEGVLLRPFFAWSLYLDNGASGFVVSGNVLNGNVNGGLFFHGGSNNTVTNNVLTGTSGAVGAASRKGDFGYYHGGVFDFSHFGQGPGDNNSVLRNIVLATANESLWSIKDALTNEDPLRRVEGNLYYSPLQKIASMRADRSGRPPFDWPNAQQANLSDGTWRGWTHDLGWDRSSLVDVAPGFRDAAHGDFSLVAGGGGTKMGFEPIDPRILPC